MGSRDQFTSIENCAFGFSRGKQTKNFLTGNNETIVNVILASPTCPDFTTNGLITVFLCRNLGYWDSFFFARNLN